MVCYADCQGIQNHRFQDFGSGRGNESCSIIGEIGLVASSTTSNSDSNMFLLFHRRQILHQLSDRFDVFSTWGRGASLKTKTLVYAS